MQVSKPVRYGVLFVVAVATLGMFFLGLDRYWAEQALAASADAPDLVVQAPAPPTEAPAPVQPVIEPPKPQLVVHVAGAVVKPGVYRFEQGARVVDAIEAAGGALPDGMPDALNLAGHLADGDKLYVPTVQEAKAQAAPSPAASGATQLPVASVSGGGAAAAAGGAPKGGKVNVNTAGQKELETVNGIGPATAKAILDYRAQQGPFRSVDDLIKVKGIGPATLEKLRPYLTI